MKATHGGCDVRVGTAIGVRLNTFVDAIFGGFFWDFRSQDVMGFSDKWRGMPNAALDVVLKELPNNESLWS